jgi:hypothetical protein
VAVTLLGLAAAGAGLALAGRPRAAAQPERFATATAAVTRGTVTERVQIAGTLGYDGSYPVVHQGAAGVLTTAPEPGDVIGRGSIVYAVANRPVRLLYGTVPAYRDLGAGISDGPDVRQLERNLVALGLDPGRQIRADTRFTRATAASIRRAQARWGVPAGRRNGALALGEVVFLPGALRVGQTRAVVGTAVAANMPVLSATSTRPVVTAQLPVDRRQLVRVRDRVQVSLVGVAPLAGTVIRVGRVATSPRDADGSSRGPTPSTVPMTIRVTPSAGRTELDQAPVQVAIITRAHRNVLMVPVAALLARSGGGYQVRLASGRFVRVQPGLFDDTAGTVELTGDLTVGDLVEVPA